MQCHINAIFSDQVFYFIPPLQKRSPRWNTTACTEASLIAVLEFAVYCIQTYRHEPFFLSLHFSRQIQLSVYHPYCSECRVGLSIGIISMPCRCSAYMSGGSRPIRVNGRLYPTARKTPCASRMG